MVSSSKRLARRRTRPARSRSSLPRSSRRLAHLTEQLKQEKAKAGALKEQLSQAKATADGLTEQLDKEKDTTSSLSSKVNALEPRPQGENRQVQLLRRRRLLLPGLRRFQQACQQASRRGVAGAAASDLGRVGHIDDATWWLVFRRRSGRRRRQEAARREAAGHPRRRRRRFVVAQLKGVKAVDPASRRGGDGGREPDRRRRRQSVAHPRQTSPIRDAAWVRADGHGKSHLVIQLQSNRLLLANRSSDSGDGAAAEGYEISGDDIAAAAAKRPQQKPSFRILVVKKPSALRKAHVIKCHDGVPSLVCDITSSEPPADPGLIEMTNTRLRTLLPADEDSEMEDPAVSFTSHPEDLNIWVVCFESGNVVVFHQLLDGETTLFFRCDTAPQAAFSPDGAMLFLATDKEIVAYSVDEKVCQKGRELVEFKEECNREGYGKKIVTRICDNKDTERVPILSLQTVKVNDNTPPMVLLLHEKSGCIDAWYVRDGALTRLARRASRGLPIS